VTPKDVTSLLDVANQHGLDAIDIALIGAIQEKRKMHDEANITELTKGFAPVGVGSVTKRLKRLYKAGYFDKQIDGFDNRRKKLIDGPKMAQLLSDLESII
jgi:DNA-binding MarR family transcriptional regulator